LAHRHEPAAHIADFFEVNIRPSPTALVFGWAYLSALAHVPMETAVTWFIALFCVAGPPVALLCLLRAFGRPRALALLAFPVSYHQQIWCGFLGSAAAVTGVLLALAAARAAVVRPRPANHLALAAALLLVAACHPFSLALLGLILIPFVVTPARPKA